MKKVVGVLMILMALVGFVVAQTEVAEAYQLLQKSRNGDTKAQKELIISLEKYTTDHSDHVFAHVILGEAYLLQARDAKEDWDKMKWTGKGFQYMDKAVQMKPDDYMIRLERGLTYFYMPAMLNKGSVARADFERLLQIVEKEKDDYFTAHPQSALYGNTGNSAVYAQTIRQMVLYYAGKIYQRDGDAEKALQLFSKCIVLNKESRFGTMAQKEVTAPVENGK